MTLVRLITFKSAILASSVKISILHAISEKFILLIALKFAKGRTATLFSGYGIAER